MMDLLRAVFLIAGGWTVLVIYFFAAGGLITLAEMIF
ncbi:hypothetical protein STSP1_00906 [Sedimentisphaera salicampi]|uniref:Uncharacterized protein n=1 Tax=Sedimentisphaera salicampi TaxID=1941349 RepID=A0A1W6LL93_9BACT|nr:hypothetical protein STSP1_00906 [Sedimentisphaera salicampi]